MSAIGMLDLRAEYAELRATIDQAMQRVLDSGHFILGPEGEALETEIAARVGVAHAVAVASGTDALHLALRAAGVPTRYATGFAMQEYSALEEAYVVRARHAHSWTRAWVDGRWIEIDTTPPDWFGVEEKRAPLWQGLSDLLRWAGFRWSQRAPLEAGAGAYALLAVLVAILVWRLLRGRRTARAAISLNVSLEVGL